MECEVCETTENVRKCPAMTGIGFNAPENKQRYVCGDCISTWRSCGAATKKDILKARGLAPPPEGK